MVQAANSDHFEMKMPRKYGGMLPERKLAAYAQNARSRMEKNQIETRKTQILVGYWTTKKEKVPQVSGGIGGEYRNRTGVHGFAIRCVTTPPTRLFK